MREWGGLTGVYRQCLIYALIAALLVKAANLFPKAPGLTYRFFQTQDLPVVIAMTLGIIWLARRATDNEAPGLPARIGAAMLTGWTGRRVGLTALGVALVGYIGHKTLFADYDMSRDEQMASFDAAIFASGRLYAVVPDLWRDAVAPLNRMFMLPVVDNAALVSAYLPGNAALRALVAQVADPDWTSPLLAAVALAAMWRVTLRLWPDAPAPRAVSLIMLIVSAQFLSLSMTAYAMTAHLALNLVWLALFLRNDARGHAGAILVGALATGLHQPIFHPLFVAPFLLWLLLDRRWGVLAIYAAAYLAIGLFWIGWPVWLSQSIEPLARAGIVNDVSKRALDQRLMDMYNALSLWAPWVMLLNLLRFIAWQHWLLLPLAVAGLGSEKKDRSLVFALALGLFLPLLASALLVPYQGHGWGYRYVHGVMGNACLLAGFGWAALGAKGWDGGRILALATAASLLTMVWLGFAAHRFVAPFAAADRAIAATDADYVVVDHTAAAFAQDLVINPPDLDARPIRLAAIAVRPNFAWFKLCRDAQGAPKTVALVGRDALRDVQQATKLGLQPPRPSLAIAGNILSAAGCTILPARQIESLRK